MHAFEGPTYLDIQNVHVAEYRTSSRMSQSAPESAKLASHIVNGSLIDLDRPVNLENE